LTIVEGTARQDVWGIDASRISATIRLDGTRVSADPLNFVLTGNPFIGSLAYDMESREGAFAVDGRVSGLQDTILHDAIDKVRVLGTAAVEASGQFGPDGFSAQGDLDASQAQISYEWWLNKPVGVGARTAFELAYDPGRSITADLDGEIASAPITARFDFRPHAPWRLYTADASSPAMAVNAVAQVLRFPYRISGGQVSEFRFHWEQTGPQEGQNASTLEMGVDHIEAQAVNAQSPITLRDAEAKLHIVNHPERVNTVTIRAQEGVLPAFGEVWFAPPPREDPLFQEFQDDETRDWLFDLRAESVQVPPWDGSSLQAEAYIKPDTSGVSRYSAIVGSGTISGDYHAEAGPNTYAVTAEWLGIPVRYLLAHLGFPTVLTGTTTGVFAYSMDRDDPNTRQGEGHFSIDEGAFSADFLVGLLQGGGQDASMLPPNLAIDRLESDVLLERDKVTTPEFLLDMEGLSAQGSGTYIFDGDMDYEVDVAIAPELADDIPVLRDSFNLDGMKVANQPLELSFNISGPVFNPQGRVADLPPASVTLVSGALGITTEVMDIPRNLLFDLLKLAGGIVASGRP